MRFVTACLVAVFLPLTAAAQDTQSVTTSSDNTSEIADLPIPSWAKTAVDSFAKPLHPVIGGIAAGGGPAVGIGYDSPDHEQWFQEADAMVSVRNYWLFEGEVGRRSASRRSQVSAFAGVRNMTGVDYFGIGPGALSADRSAFLLRETTFGARGWHRPLPSVRVGGGAAMYLPQVGHGTNRSVPSIEERFSQSTIPSFSSEHRFGRYRGFVEYTYPAPADSSVAQGFSPASSSVAQGFSPANADTYHGTYQLALEIVRDYDERRHNFHRWEAAVQQRIPGFRTGQRLTLHGFFTTTSAGDVPFYMLYPLGGSGGLKAFRPDLLGSDGTRATLRGVHNYRFRDRELVLLQAEYRIPLFANVDSTVFVDTGQVAPRRSQLFSDLKTSTGFSLSYMHKGRTLGRMDVGFGGDEGVQVFWSFGAFRD